MTNQKDFSNLIKAFSLTANTLDLIRLVIIGSGEQKESLQDHVKDLGLESTVKFLGFQSNPYKFMNASDLFVMSSKWEGPGHVLIEALATGCPVITTNCPIGPSDSVQNGEFGQLVEVGNSSALSEAILLAEESEIISQCLGKPLKDIFIENKKLEWEDFSSSVTDYEKNKYLFL